MIDHAALRTEIDNDPDALGYKEAGGAWKADAVIADVINERRAAYRISRGAVPKGELYGLVDWDGEFMALTSAKKQGFIVVTDTPAIDGSSPHIRDAMLAIWGDTSATYAALLDAFDRDGSRAEALWGENATVSHLDVAKARSA